MRKIIEDFTRNKLEILKPILKPIRLQKPITKILGPRYTRSRKRIEIDINYLCNLKCANCNRSCSQAPSSDRMTVRQIQKFIAESKKNKIQWERIRILGGEPTLHPDIFEIVSELLVYKRENSTNTQVVLITNGYGKKVNEILKKIPQEVEIDNTGKTSSESFFEPFNLAPKDDIKYKYADYTNGCWHCAGCGMGLTPYGYYMCAVAGGIDRMLGFNQGRKKLPEIEDDMEDLLNLFCKYCGHFKYSKPTKEQKISISWIKAYKKYNEKKPKMIYYGM